MRVEHLSPFAEACSAVLQALLGSEPDRGALSVKPCIEATEQINLVCKVRGDIAGHVLFGMTLATADRIASKILGSPVVTFDAAGAKAIAELGNMINSHALDLLAAHGLKCDIEPAAVVRGKGGSGVFASVPALVIPMNLRGWGKIEVTVGLQDQKKQVA